MLPKRIVIVGGPGKTGGRVFSKLRFRGVDAYTVSRSTKPGFDWTDRVTWAGALAGASAAYVTYQPDLAVPRAADDIEAFSAAAAEGGLEHVVLLSGRGEEGAVASEERLRRAPIDHTILRASWFSQNFSEGAFLDGILAGELTLPADKIAEPFVSVDDIADVALEALCNPAHRNQTYELTGPRLLTFADAVAEIAAASGRDLRYQAVPAGAFLANLRHAGFDKELVWLLEDLFTRTLDGRNAMVMPDIQTILGRKAQDFTEYARRAARTGAWQPEMQPARA